MLNNENSKTQLCARETGSYLVKLGSYIVNRITVDIN